MVTVSQFACSKYRKKISANFIQKCTQSENGIKYFLKPSYNRSPYIFTLVQKVKHREYKISVFFLNVAILCQNSASYFI